MSDEHQQEQPPPNFPNYPSAPQVASRKEAGQLAKIVGRMIKPAKTGKIPHRAKSGKPGTRGKGLQSNQNVHIGRKRPKFY